MIRLKENQKEIDNVIFDIGNVLVHYAPRKFMFEMGIAPKLHDRLAAVLCECPQRWCRMDLGTLDEAGIIEEASRDEPTLRKEIAKYTKTWSDFLEPVVENVAFFYAVKEAGCKAYLLSNYATESFAVLEKRNVFIQDADGMIISSKYGVAKPDPKIYQLLIDTYQLDTQRSVFFDDVAENVEGAQKAGLNAVLLPPCASIADFFEMPTE